MGYDVPEASRQITGGALNTKFGQLTQKRRKHCCCSFVTSVREEHFVRKITRHVCGFGKKSKDELSVDGDDANDDEWHVMLMLMLMLILILNLTYIIKRAHCDSCTNSVRTVLRYSYLTPLHCNKVSYRFSK